MLVVCGCDRTNSGAATRGDPNTRAFWIQYFTAALGKGTYAGEEAERVRRLLIDLKTHEAKVLPRLLTVTEWWETDQNQGGLTLCYYAEERVISTVRVREYKTSNQADIVEDYEVYPDAVGAGKWLDCIYLDFAIRTHGERKDDVAWGQYRGNSNTKEGLMPKVWVSSPSPNHRVDISLVDRLGRETNAVELPIPARKLGSRPTIKRDITD